MASTTKVAFMDNSWQPAVGNTPESLRQFVESQRELFHIQIDQLQKIVSTQCKLTGVNPLSQEMAAGALSIKIGKRPRDLLNPKAIKYMQSIFSIKDAVSKKESREISALFGVTVTQVRDFFAGQRSRVRKFFQLSRDKTVRSNACESPQDGFLMTSSPVVIIDPTPLDTVNPAKLDEPPSCSTQDEALLAIDESEKRFVESIFNLMRKEETFSAQEKLMEWILQIKNASILYWFLNKGGVMILATWLSQAALEEQTTVLFIILKVLCHLPLHKAFPEHMSAILQSVNRLRFYQSPDISNRARVLLSRWSKLFARSQALKKPNGLKSSVDAQKEMLLKQSISEIIDDELWQSKTADPDENLDHSRENSDNLRKSEPHQTPKAPPVSTDVSKNNRGVYSSQTRERRKVVLVESPGQKTASRSQPGAKVKPANQGRPISADDIQKAKLRAQYMQRKYGKVGSNESNEPKIEGPNRSLSARAGVFLLPSKVNLRPKIEEQRKPAAFNRQGAPCLKRPLSESLLAKCKRVQLPWRTPPEIRMNEIWRVGAGESSKEVEIQKNRNHRDKETFYRTVHDIPPNPQEPWDTEIDCDDTLTPEIPTEPLPDADITTEPHHVPAKEADTRAAVSSTATPSQLSSGDDAVEPDFELLAILLKNPELVFALTSGQAGSLSHEQTVKLLDVIKRTGAGLPGNLNPLGGRSEEKVEVSLPSPTPSSHLGMSGWPSEAARNPFTKQRSTATATVYASAAVATTSIPLQQPADLATTLERYATVPDGLPSVQRTHLSYETSRVLHSHTPEIEPWKRAPLVGTYAGHNVSAGTATQTHAKFGAFGTSEMDFTSPAVLSQAPSSPYQIRPVGNPDPTHDSWRERQRVPSKDYSRFDQSNCSSFVGGFVRRPGLFSDQSIGRNELGTTREEFESWSPEGSPNRPSCRKYSEPRINPGPYSRYSQSYRHEFSRNQSSSSSGYRESTGRGSRRWRDGDRRR